MKEKKKNWIQLTKCRETITSFHTIFLIIIDICKENFLNNLRDTKIFINDK